MHLFNLAEFGKRYSIDLTVSDFLDAVTEASKAASAGLASHLRYGDWDAYNNRKDVFQCLRSFSSGNMQKLQFRLSRGFVVEDSSFSAFYSSSPVNIRNMDTGLMTDLQSVSGDAQSDYLYIDHAKGVLTVYGIDLTDQWVVVTYSGGLDVDTDDEYVGVPDWLREAAMVHAALHLSRNRAFQTEGADDTSFLKTSLKSMLDGNWRATPSAKLPVATEV